MPNMIPPNEGKELLLYWMLSTAGGDLENFVCELFQNNYTVIETSVMADFTPATFPGYSPVGVGRADFLPVALVGNIATITLPSPPTYDCTGGGGQLCYGWFLYGATSEKVVFAQNFASARDMTTGASEILSPFTISLKTYA